MYRFRYCIVVLLCLSYSFAKSNYYSKPTVLPFGTFQPENHVRSGGARRSEDGEYRASYERAEDNISLANLTLFSGGKELFSMTKVPGSGVSVSNAGYLIVTGETKDYNQRVTVFTSNGNKVGQYFFKDPDLLNFSPDGTRLIIGDASGLHIVNLEKKDQIVLPKATQCVLSKDNSIVATADDSLITIYKGQKKLHNIAHNDFYIRALAISPDNQKVAFIGQRALAVISITSGESLLTDNITGSLTFRDIRLSDETLWAGIHDRDRKKRESRGLLRTYNLKTRAVTTSTEAVFTYEPEKKLNYNYKKTRNGLEELPWPFKPFDQPQKQWNGYLQLAASRDGTSGIYCHQGLDMDVPSYAKCYSIDTGYVKCKITIMNPGDLYWRVAVSEVQVPDTSDGWLYAHLEKSTIGVDVGDMVYPGDYIGEIIPWNGLTGGHIHFSRIRDHGTTWKYNDGQWWNTHSPLEQLRPLNDNSAPVIKNVFSSSKFGLMTNDADGWMQYLDADQISGEIDILVRVQETAWQSPWIQPAYEIKYWLKNLDKGLVELDTTEGTLRKNTMVAQYSGNLYNNLATAMYHVTNQFTAKGWFTKGRDYLHIITNVTDTFIQSDDDIEDMKHKALNTALYADGNYRLYVEAFDAAYNSTLDSMDMVFKNGVNTIMKLKKSTLQISHSIKNKKLELSLDGLSQKPLKIRVYSLQGKVVETKEFVPTGTVQKVAFNNSLASGMYLCTIEANEKVFQKILTVQ